VAIEALGLAYAMTVHASQGSEYERILFICVNGSPSFIHCGILFTAFSRAKKHLHIIGDPDVLRQVARRPVPRRNSGLIKRFRTQQAASPSGRH
jgi:exodeoxyribonuclease V alpha subunit